MTQLTLTQRSDNWTTTELPNEVWFRIIHSHASKAMWPICREVCHAWRSLLHRSVVRLAGYGTPCTDKIAGAYRDAVCTTLASKGWTGCLLHLLEMGWRIPESALYASLRGGDTNTSRWILENVGEGFAPSWGRCLSAAARSGSEEAIGWVKGATPGGAVLGPFGTEDALEFGQLDTVEWLWERGKRDHSWLAYCIACAAARRGRLRVLEWMLGQGDMIGVWSSVVVDVAGDAGRLDIVKWLLDKTRSSWRPVASPFDGRMRHTELFKWAVSGEMRAARVSLDDEELACSAAYHGNVECLRWICERSGIAVSAKVANHAAASGRTEALLWTVEKGVPPDSGCWELVVTNRQSIADERTRRDAIAVLEFLVSTVGVPDRLIGLVCQRAVWLGDSAIVGRLISTRSPSNTDELWVAATRYAGIEVLRVLKERLPRPGESVAIAAADRGDVPIFRWLIEQGGCKHSPGMRMEMDVAMSKGRWELATWINQHPSHSSLLEVQEGAMDV